MSPIELPLRDVHEPVAPPWWPPAPGWWIVFGVLLAIVAMLAWWRWRRARRQRLAARLFDDTVAAADTPVQQVAAISGLLRRAARQRHPAAATLDGDDWLRLLDEGLPPSTFAGAPAALLRDGAFRPEVDQNAVEALRIAARARFLDWMAPRR